MIGSATFLEIKQTGEIEKNGKLNFRISILFSNIQDQTTLACMIQEDKLRPFGIYYCENVSKILDIKGFIITNNHPIVIKEKLLKIEIYVKNLIL